MLVFPAFLAQKSPKLFWFLSGPHDSWRQEQHVSKKVFVKTYGCQMNVYDSNRMVNALKPHGYEVSETPEDAYLVILNTCNILEKAASKVYSEICRLK